MGKKMKYNDSFYEMRDGKTSYAAETILRILISKYKFNSVIDVGCGVGTWLQAAQNLGVKDCRGIEGPWLKRSDVVAKNLAISMQNLLEPIVCNDRFDLALSLEVAEHLPLNRAEAFVSELCNLAPIILFGAAMPGQTRGINHINLQWQDWWRKKFADNGYEAVDALRPIIWRDTKIPIWYRQNALLYARPETFFSLGYTQNDFNFVADIVHPELYLKHKKNDNLFVKFSRFLRGKPQ